MSTSDKLSAMAERLESKLPILDQDWLEGTRQAIQEAAEVMLKAAEENELLLKALRPFADAADVLRPEDQDDWWLEDALYEEHRLKVSDLRAARAAALSAERGDA